MQRGYVETVALSVNSQSSTRYTMIPAPLDSEHLAREGFQVCPLGCMSVLLGTQKVLHHVWSATVYVSIEGFYSRSSKPSEHHQIHHRPTPPISPSTTPITPTMFRTALLRSARLAVRAAPRSQAAIARPVARSSLFSIKQITPSARFQAVRCYSAAAGLSKDEVQGRIMDLLKNFDKVMTTLNMQPSR